MSRRRDDGKRFWRDPEKREGVDLKEKPRQVYFLGGCPAGVVVIRRADNGMRPVSRPRLSTLHRNTRETLAQSLGIFQKGAAAIGWIIFRPATRRAP